MEAVVIALSFCLVEWPQLATYPKLASPRVARVRWHFVFTVHIILLRLQRRLHGELTGEGVASFWHMRGFALR